MRIIKFEKLKPAVHNVVTSDELTTCIKKMNELLLDSHSFITSNMIGYNNLRIILLKIDRPTILVNPKITHYGKFTTTNFPDTCLMYPNELIKTTRNTRIIVTADNHENPIIFGIDKVIENTDVNKMLESGYIQHAIDVLHGKSMFYHQTTILEKNIKKNQFIEVEKDNIVKKIKGQFLYRELSLGYKLKQ